jgi:hypothetical protein
MDKAGGSEGKGAEIKQLISELEEMQTNLQPTAFRFTPRH